MKNTKVLGSVVILGIVWLAVVSFRSMPAAIVRSSTAARLASTSIPEVAKLQALQSYGNLPLSFEANQGQTGGPVKFISRGSGYTLFLTPTEAVLSLQEPAASQDRTTKALPGMSKPVSSEQLTPRSRPLLIAKSALLRVEAVGANPAPHLSGLEELPGKSNYFIGKDPTKWHTDVPTYAKVRYQEVYPGVDWVYYGNQHQLEQDFIVAPGADPKVITLRFQGADRLELDAQGDLVLHVGDGEVRLRKPNLYQEGDGGKRPSPGGYELKGTHQVGFEVSTYDKTKPLVIDPVLAYSTYLGGGSANDGFGIAVDSSGNAYVTGYTYSTNFPTTTGAFQTAFGGTYDAFVTKLNAAGSALIYSTYLGGNQGDLGRSIAVDSYGNAYVTGTTQSTNFPTSAGAFQTAFGGGTDDAFVTKLNATGTGLLYSTYLGGNDTDHGGGIAVDSSGNAYVTGYTASTSFPTTAAAFQTAYGGGGDSFVTKLNTAGTGLVYSTYLGGNNTDQGDGIAVDSSGNAYVTGWTSSTDFPTTAGAFQTAFGGGSQDAFVTKLDATGNALVYSTYLGGSIDANGYGIAVDSSGSAYVTGLASTPGFPTTAGAFQTTFGRGGDAFVTKLNAAGTGLVYSTYLGGSGIDVGYGIAVDSSGNAYVTGYTDSATNFPIVSPLQHRSGGLTDAFVTELNATGSALVYSTYLGGSADDFGIGINVDSSGNAYVTGYTDSTNFPTTTGAFQTVFSGTEDVFVTKISPTSSPRHH